MIAIGRAPIQFIINNINHNKLIANATGVKNYLICVFCFMNGDSMIFAFV